MYSLVPIGAGCLVCMMPLALYLLFLATLHQRSKPTVLTGAWDFTCVLLGLSGFLLTGGLMLLSTLDSTLRSFWFNGSFSQIRAAWRSDPRIWSSISFGYLVILSLFIGFQIRRRRKWTMLYNLDRMMAEEMLIHAVESLGYTFQRIGYGIQITGRSQDKIGLSQSTPGAFAPAKIQIDAFASLQHVGLRWTTSDPDLQQQVAATIEQACESAESPQSTVGGWFLTASVSIFLVMLLWMIFLIYTVMNAPR